MQSITKSRHLSVQNTISKETISRQKLLYVNYPLLKSEDFQTKCLVYQPTIKGAASYDGRVSGMECETHETAGKLYHRVWLLLSDLTPVQVPGT